MIQKRQLGVPRSCDEIVGGVRSVSAMVRVKEHLHTLQSWKLTIGGCWTTFLLGKPTKCTAHDWREGITLSNSMEVPDWTVKFGSVLCRRCKQTANGMKNASVLRYLSGRQTRRHVWATRSLGGYLPGLFPYHPLVPKRWFPPPPGPPTQKKKKQRNETHTHTHWKRDAQLILLLLFLTACPARRLGPRSALPTSPRGSLGARGPRGARAADAGGGLWGAGGSGGAGGGGPGGRSRRSGAECPPHFWILWFGVAEKGPTKRECPPPPSLFVGFRKEGGRKNEGGGAHMSTPQGSHLMVQVLC